MRRRALAVVAALATGLLAPALARADHRQRSIFQDDNHLLYSSTRVVSRTLAELRSLGVQTIRITVKWSNIAPASGSRKRPRNFDAANPAAYPAQSWFAYDRVLALAARDRIGVEFLITAPGPLWAMAHSSPVAREANHWVPSPLEFAWFVRALGRRYDGRYHAYYGTVPRVDTWAIWNEPNQPGWLAPQWVSAGHEEVPISAALYRGYVDVAYYELAATGHTARTDTILIGELAPEGAASPGEFAAMAPLEFLRALYCVDRRFRALRGRAATLLGCPPRGPASKFAAAHPGLFHASAFAHHPYYFFHPPWQTAQNPDYVPIANLGRLEHWLDRAMSAYGVHRRIPIYLTEYGYQTNPPSPYAVVSPSQQAAYLNDADHIAWRDPRVRSVAQFLLYDSGPDRRFAPTDFDYWDKFQTGLRFASGRPKPAMQAYRMPIWIPGTNLRRHRRLFVWGQLRPASDLAALKPQVAGIEWRPARGAWRTVTAVLVRGLGAYFTAQVRLPGSGLVRTSYFDGRVLYSRAVAVRVS